MIRAAARHRPILVLVLAAAITTLIVGARTLLGSDGVPTGSALDNEGSGGILQPLPPNTPLALGIVYVENQSEDPIELVDARLLRLDRDLELLGFSVLPMGPGPYGSNPPITWLEYPLPGQVPLPEYPPVPPSKDDEAAAKIMFGLKVREGGAGKAVGVEVTYRQKGKLRRQLFREQVYVCSVASLQVDDCPGVEDEMDVFGDFEDEVKGISRRREE